MDKKVIKVDFKKENKIKELAMAMFEKSMEEN